MKEISLKFIKELLTLSYILTDENITFYLKCISNGEMVYVYDSNDKDFDYEKVDKPVTFLSIYIMGDVKGEKLSQYIEEFFIRCQDLAKEHNLLFKEKTKGNWTKLSFFQDPSNIISDAGQDYSRLCDVLFEANIQMDWEAMLKEITDLSFIIKDEGLSLMIHGETELGHTHMIYRIDPRRVPEVWMSTRYHELENEFVGIWINIDWVKEDNSAYLEYCDRLGEIAKKWGFYFTCPNPHSIRFRKKTLKQEWDKFNKSIKESHRLKSEPKKLTVQELILKIEEIKFLVEDENIGFLIENKMDHSNPFLIIHLFNHTNENLPDNQEYLEFIDRLTEICKSAGYDSYLFPRRDDIIVVKPLDPTNEALRKSVIQQVAADIKDLNYIMNDENIGVTVNISNDRVHVNLDFDKTRKFKTLLVGSGFYKEYVARLSGIADDYGFRLKKAKKEVTEVKAPHRRLKTDSVSKFGSKQVDDDFKFIVYKKSKPKRILERYNGNEQDQDLLDEISSYSFLIEDEGLKLEFNKSRTSYPHSKEFDVTEYTLSVNPQSKEEWENKANKLYQRRWDAYIGKRYAGKESDDPKLYYQKHHEWGQLVSPKRLEWYDPFCMWLVNKHWFLEWRDRIKEICHENGYMCYRIGWMMIIRKKSGEPIIQKKNPYPFKRKFKNKWAKKIKESSGWPHRPDDTHPHWYKLWKEITDIEYILKDEGFDMYLRPFHNYFEFNIEISKGESYSHDFGQPAIKARTEALTKLINSEEFKEFKDRLVGLCDKYNYRVDPIFRAKAVTGKDGKITAEQKLVSNAFKIMPNDLEVVKEMNDMQKFMLMHGEYIKAEDDSDEVVYLKKYEEDIKDILIDLSDNGIELDISSYSQGETKLSNDPLSHQSKVQISHIPIIKIYLESEKVIETIIKIKDVQESIHGLNDFLFTYGLGLQVLQPKLPESDATRYVLEDSTTSAIIRVSFLKYLDKLSIPFRFKHLSPFVTTSHTIPLDQSGSMGDRDRNRHDIEFDEIAKRIQHIAQFTGKNINI